MGCTPNPNWEEYYNGYPETANKNVWDAMQEDLSISQFTDLLEQYQLDTLFNSDLSYTVFAPSEEAFDAFLDTIDEDMAKYHICTHLINSSRVEGKRKIQTLTDKFLLFEKSIGASLVDGIYVRNESSLFKNGKYYVLDSVLSAKPSLYECFSKLNPVLKTYIDGHDSIILNRDQSQLIGYDDFDNPVFDSVNEVINLFELAYFEVKQEFREKTATIAFPSSGSYNAALNVMADNLSSDFTDFEDIPIDWQYEILLPYLVDKGIFDDMVEPDEFLQTSPTVPRKLLNILGDSVVIDYSVKEKILCSNGYAYDYDFSVPLEFYAGNKRLEGESLTELTNEDSYSWKEEVEVQSPIGLQPYVEYSGDASDNYVARVNFTGGYDGEFAISFDGPKLFPRKYVMEFRTHMQVGGEYEFYVNDERLLINGEQLPSFDYGKFQADGGFIFGVEDFYTPDGQFN